jgi:hypothetical protein
MNKLSLTEKQMHNIINMGKNLHPLMMIEVSKDYKHIYVSEKSSKVLVGYFHWLEFCLLNIIPKLKVFYATDQKEFMQNIIANFHEGARCCHPVDHLYELFLKGG